jgi:drug/metabolite transporter (DMT)-like permease
VVPFLAGIGGRAVRPVTWASAFAAVVGVSLLERTGAAPCWGDAFSLLSALAFGVQASRGRGVVRLLCRPSPPPARWPAAALPPPRPWTLNPPPPTPSSHDRSSALSTGLASLALTRLWS